MSPPTAKVVLVIVIVLPSIPGSSGSSRGSLLQDIDKLRERGGGRGERLDLLVRDLGQVPAENSAEPSTVILERDVPAFGHVDEDDASVAGLACPRHESLFFELLDQERDRWLRQALDLSELGDPPAIKSRPDARLAAGTLGAELLWNRTARLRPRALDKIRTAGISN
jgi:hypothetical protein